MKTNYIKSTIISIRKFLFLFIILVILPLNMMGKIAFAYDAAGNRIKRELVIVQMNKAPSNLAGVKENYYDSIGEKKVTLSSDISGIIQISINDFNEEDKGHVSVYSLSGINVLDNDISESCIRIDLSSNPKGIYILCVTINDNQTTWKINKK